MAKSIFTTQVARNLLFPTIEVSFLKDGVLVDKKAFYAPEQVEKAKTKWEKLGVK